LAGVLDWLRVFRTYAYKHPQLWGIHNYLDANHFIVPAQSTTAKIIKYLPGEIWLTQTGGIVESSSFAYDEQRAAGAIDQVFALAAMSSRITRVYLYNWYGITTPKLWDSGLVAQDGTPRPGLAAVRRNTSNAAGMAMPRLEVVVGDTSVSAASPSRPRRLGRSVATRACRFRPERERGDGLQAAGA
jgi:hypothetical protein